MDFFQDLLRFITLTDYSTRVVVFGCVTLGAAAGLIGPFMMLRRRSLLADATSHAMLPGIAMAFLIMHAVTGNGKWLPGLLLGALISGLLGMLCIVWINRHSRLEDDTALAIVLSVFYGFGAALLGIIQKMEGVDAAGLNSFVVGKTASMLWNDALLIAICALVIMLLVIVLYKEFTLLCFDSDFSRAQGWPTTRLDIAMMGIVVVTTVIGLRAVGLVLMIALLVIPAAAARFWTDNLWRLLWISAGIGAVSCWLGAMWSSTVSRVSAGASMVLCATLLFVISLMFGPARGLLLRWHRRRRLRFRTQRDHLLRALYEHEERTGQASLSYDELFALRGWNRSQLGTLLHRCLRKHLVYRNAEGRYCCTDSGQIEARQLVRNHRLWELYMMRYADVAASHVDRVADRIEHVLGKSMVAKLEAELATEPGLHMPESPHQLEGPRETSGTIS